MSSSLTVASCTEEPPSIYPSLSEFCYPGERTEGDLVMYLAQSLSTLDMALRFSIEHGVQSLTHVGGFLTGVLGL